MDRHFFTRCLAFLLHVYGVAPEQDFTVTLPPLITKHPPQKLVFVEQESIQLPCRASGSPTPRYTWRRNGQPFDPTGTQGLVAMNFRDGTLVFSRPKKRDAGIYQCFATNQLGMALSEKVHLFAAYIETFRSTATRTHTVTVGAPLTLPCVPPRSLPTAVMFWATSDDPTGDRLAPLDIDDRVTMDYEGNLRISNVIPSDSRHGEIYLCVAQNRALRHIEKGAFQRIQHQTGTSMRARPRTMWISPTRQMVLTGKDLRLKCIFSGSPSPRVSWTRQDGALPARARQNSFGMELVIVNIEMSDAGTYECQGINDEAQVPIRHSFSITVQAVPTWIQRPSSETVAEQELKTFRCEASGIPEPNIQWFRNGIPYIEYLNGTSISQDGRVIIQDGTLTFMNTTQADSTVLQCNASNKHGYVFTNFYLNVMNIPATISQTQETRHVAAIGQTVMLRCDVSGSPKPEVTWTKEGADIQGDRFTMFDNKSLQIQLLKKEDGGLYRCHARNIFGSRNATVSLIIRENTQIVTEPEPVRTEEGNDVTFHCAARTDPNETNNLRITWQKDGRRIDFGVFQRASRSLRDNSLTIRGLIPYDTAKYTCVATNGIDEDQATADLIVMGVPDPPYDVRVSRYDKIRATAQLSWRTGRDNYAPVTRFIAQYNTSFNPEKWTSFNQEIMHFQRQVVVPLSPWANYSFRILALNQVGSSPPSYHTVTVELTTPDVPDKNPENVRGEGDQPNNLIIYWKPLTKLEQNGPGLYYIVGWRRVNYMWAYLRIDDPQAYKYQVPGRLPTYQPFQVSVSASNNIGDAPHLAVVVTGYSGEDVPLVAPSDIAVDTSSIRSTEAELYWSQVDTSSSAIRGFFRGYRVNFWTTGHPVRKQDIILQESYRLYLSLPRQVVAKITHLWPYSNISFHVQVLNKYYVGPPSETGHFSTPEGTPGPPASFTVIGRGSDYISVLWEKPMEPNGNIIGYKIDYQTVNDLKLGPLHHAKPILGLEMGTNINVTGLEAGQPYRLYLYGVTRAGQGEAIFLQAATRPPSEADVLEITSTPSPPSTTKPATTTKPVTTVKTNAASLTQHNQLIVISMIVSWFLLMGHVSLSEFVPEM